MDDSNPTKSSHSAALLIGILLTCLAVVSYRFLPERRLTLQASERGDNFFLMQSGDGAPADIQWVDQGRFHFACQFPKATVEQLNKVLNEVLADPAVVKRLEDHGLEVTKMSTDQMRTYVQDEQVKWKKVVQAAKLTAD